MKLYNDDVSRLLYEVCSCRNNTIDEVTLATTIIYCMPGYTVKIRVLLYTQLVKYWGVVIHLSAQEHP